VADARTEHYAANKEGDRKGHVIEVSNGGVFPTELLRCANVPVSMHNMDDAADAAATDIWQRRTNHTLKMALLCRHGLLTSIRIKQAVSSGPLCGQQTDINAQPKRH